MIAEGGKTVYGATIGILMLETRFPRIPGSMGDVLTGPFPAMWKAIRQRAEGTSGACFGGVREMGRTRAGKSNVDWRIPSR